MKRLPHVAENLQTRSAYQRNPQNPFQTTLRRNWGHFIITFSIVPQTPLYNSSPQKGVVAMRIIQKKYLALISWTQHDSLGIKPE